jgi:membrane-bound lytic murein transglycosylase A
VRALAAGAACLILAACATPHGPVPKPEPPRRLELSELPGWSAEDHVAAFDAIRETCAAARDPLVDPICRRARNAGPLPRSAARTFLETEFQAAPSPGTGVLTAYYAPAYQARRRPDAEFSAPLRPRPADLGQLTPYPDRAAIEARPADDALAWLRPEELFFLQVQGSGVLTFEDGRRMKALYAANNGLPFVGIANPMRDRGHLPRDGTSAEAIRAWLAAHRGPQAYEIMRLNPRYAFFTLAPDDGKPPAGAAGVPLPAGRAIAVDPAFHRYGEVYWIDADAPLLAGAFPAYRRLVIALDTGGAIKGDVRADLYLGQGAAAGVEAGRVRHTLRLYRLVPR